MLNKLITQFNNIILMLLLYMRKLKIELKIIFNQSNIYKYFIQISYTNTLFFIDIMFIDTSLKLLHVCTNKNLCK